MRDSINYNLKYFIMKMSGTKPMKNTMRKPSPLKFAELSTPEGKAASYGASKPKGTTKPVEGKPSSKPAAPRGPLARAKAKAAVSSRTTKPSPLKFADMTASLLDMMKKSSEMAGSTAKDKAEAKKAEYLKGKKSATTETATDAKARQEKVKAARAMSKLDRATAAKAKMDRYKSGSKSTTSTGTSTTTPAKQLKKAGMKKKC